MQADQPAARIAVLLPCYNEALTIARVIGDFRAALPEATIYVYDNNSTDDTARLAREAGAQVRFEKRQGKGFVIASMLAEVEADYYLMADGDDTYPADRARDLLQPVLDGRADMVVGQRLATFQDASFRPMHLWGNRLVRDLINVIFSAKLVDILSGYRAFTREVALQLPVVASGFDVETEMTLQLLFRRMVIQEIPIAYGVRPEGSVSKLRTYSDGLRVLMKILGIFKAYKPMTFFGGLGLVFLAVGLGTGAVVLHEYFTIGRIDSVPLAVLSASAVLLSFLLASVGVTLHTLNFRILEMTHVLSKQIGAGRSAGVRRGS
jgi:glycosyltransferase involved in cell wall biosynthesis